MKTAHSIKRYPDGKFKTVRRHALYPNRPRTICGIGLTGLHEDRYEITLEEFLAQGKHCATCARALTIYPGKVAP